MLYGDKLKKSSEAGTWAFRGNCLNFPVYVIFIPATVPIIWNTSSRISACRPNSRKSKPNEN